MLAAGVGAIPGGRLITKGAKELAQPIRAYHGSPHDFDKFDLSKIGTGEGAQAYGHGLYFAENEKVAKGYRDALGGKQYRGSSDPAHMAFDDIQYLNGNKDAAISSWRSDIRDRPNTPAGIAAAQKLAAYDSGAVAALNPGHMYEVNIHADPAKFLDWDKPLSQQSQSVQKIAGTIPTHGVEDMHEEQLRGVLQKIDPSGVWNAMDQRAELGREMSWGELIKAAKQMGVDRYLAGNGPGDLSQTGATLYHRLDAANLGNPMNVSNALAAEGIPGIKYLDGGSRAAGDGSRNYVAFDDKLIEILRKYGLLPVAAGTAMAGAALPQDGGDY